MHAITRNKTAGASGFSGQIVGLNPHDLDNYKHRVKIVDNAAREKAVMAQRQYELKSKGSGKL